MPRAKKMSVKEEFEDYKKDENVKLRKEARFQQAEARADKADKRASSLARAGHEKDRTIDDLKEKLFEAKGQYNDYSKAFNEERAAKIVVEEENKQLKAASKQGDGGIKRKYDKLLEQHEELHADFDELKVTNEELGKNYNQKNTECLALQAEKQTIKNELAEVQKECNEAVAREEQFNYHKEALGIKTGEGVDVEKVEEAIARLVAAKNGYDKAFKEFEKDLQKIAEGLGLSQAAVWAAVENFLKAFVVKVVYNDTDDTKYAYPTTDAESVLYQVLVDTKLYHNLLSATSPDGVLIHHNPRGKEDLPAYGKRLEKTIQMFKLIWGTGTKGKHLCVENGEVIVVEDDEWCAA